MKGVDGSLRHSLYRTGQEVLYLPLTNRVRSRAKTLIDSFGNRGGQAVASVLILLSLSIGASIVQISVFVAVLCIVWVFTIAIMQPRYLELFRARLKMGAVETRMGQAELDLHSLETLLNSLSSEDDGEVLAAIDLFSAHGKSSLLPVLLLYHPSKEITLRALQAFTSENDPRFVSVAKRLLRSESEEIRAAALRALASIGSHRTLLKKHLLGDTPAVQATALVGLLATDKHNRDLKEQLDTWLEVGSDDTRVQLARAIGDQKEGVFNNTLIRLSKMESLEIRQATAHAMAKHPHFDLMPHLLPMLGVSELRSCARKALVALGDPALQFLKKKLNDESVVRKVRRHIPRTISRFDAIAASEILMDHMLVEKDSAIRHKSLRGLGRLIATDSNLRLDNKKLDLLIESSLVRGLQMMKWRSVSDQEDGEMTAGASLLYATLVEKEKRLLERSFRLLGLRFRREDFSLIWRGLGSEDRKIQSASRELLDGALAGNLREAVLAMVDDDSIENRIQRASRVLKQPSEPATYESALVSMLDDSSEAVRGIAAYHIAELGIDDLAPELERARESNQGPVRDAIDRALRKLSARPPHGKGVPSVA